MDNSIKVGFCVAYDWQMLEFSLPLVYPEADVICLSVDANKTSWSGLKFQFDDTRFRDLISRIDVGKKIQVYEADFYDPSLTPMQNEVRQRNMIANFLGKGGWHVQLDCDEYFPDFKKFVAYLRSLPARLIRHTNISCFWIHLFKKVEDGYLIVDPGSKNNLEYIQVATREPNYEYGRRNGNFNIYTPFGIIHQSWARGDEEIKQKIFNWGHSNDFDKEAYFSFWKNLDQNNSLNANNFHPLVPSLWPRLMHYRPADLRSLISNFDNDSFPRYDRMDLALKNSRFVSRLKKIFKLWQR